MQCRPVRQQWYLENFDPITDIPSGAYLSSFYSGNVNAGKIQEMFDYIKQYNIIIHPERIFSLDDIQEAHSYLESRTGFGKVVVIP